MVFPHALKYRNRCLRSLVVLGILFYLAKGQSSLYAAADCSGDPIATTVELVISDLPDYGGCFHQFCTPSNAVGTTFALPENGFPSGHTIISARYDAYARLVLKSTDYVFTCLSRNKVSIKTRSVLHQSPDADPLLSLR